MLRFVTSSDDSLSLEDLRVAILNYLIAKQKNKKFLIRLTSDDTEVLELLTLFGITADEVSYQSYNLKFHQQLATKLLMDKNAFNCFCNLKTSNEKYNGTCKNLPDSEVIDNENPFSVRIKKPKTPIKINDELAGDAEYLPDDIDDFLILNIDKTPTNNFACAIDDMLSDISLVVKSNKYFEDTPKQIHIRKKLGYDKDIKYIHLPTISEDISIKSLLEQGFLPQTITNYLLLLTCETTQKFFTLDEAKEWFEISKISKSSAKFDIKELKSLNKEHIKAMDSVKLATLVGFKSKDIGELAKVYTKEENTINDIKEKIDKIFSKKECKKETYKKLYLCMKDAPHFEDFSKYEDYLLKNSGVKGKDFSQALSFLLTGVHDNPNISDIYPYIKNYIKEIIRCS
jgi:glutamyl-tRNA synthetase